MADGDARLPSLIVGVGGSAGGLEALVKLLKAAPRSDGKGGGLAFVVVQHLDPTQESMLPEILGRATELEVFPASDRQPLRPDAVYVIQPGTQLTLVDHELRVAPQPTRRSVAEGVDHFFVSLAEVFGDGCAGIVLSGTGRDGTRGLRSIRAAGGITLAQDPSTAAHDSMPQSVIDAGLADLVLPVEEMPEMLMDYARRRSGPGESSTTFGEDVLDEVATILRANEEFDLAKYKSGTVGRRIRRRVGLAGMEGTEPYLQLLREEPEERQGLIRDMMIGVTDFFRDPEAYEALATEALPKIIESRRGADAPIRIWCAGCASGEEPYSIAMLVSEVIADMGSDAKVQVFATDVDENALAIARAGIYPPTISAHVSEGRLQRFFDRIDDNGYRVKSSLRNMVSFAVHDLCVDPPFSQLDLVTCRNLLIYLRRRLQREVFQTFHFALRRDGFLFLGGSESTGESAKYFHTVVKRHRIYSRSSARRTEPLLRASAGHRRAFRGATLKEPRAPEREPLADEARQVLIDGWVPACVVVDVSGAVVFVHGDVGQFLHLPSGEPRLELMAMLEPDLRTRVRAALYKCRRDGAPVTVEAGNPRADAGARTRITVRPSPSRGKDLVAVGFERLSSPDEATLTEVDEEQERILDQLEKELEATQEDLRNTVEELETSNEELRAANEESTSINEELQSANEELEATTEELRSLNEELTTVNAQLKLKIDQVQEAHDDLQNFFASTQLAVLFLDESLRIKRFTPEARRLLRLQDSDRKRSVDDLKRELFEHELPGEARAVLDQLVPKTTLVEIEDGRTFERRILPYRSGLNRIEGVVVAYIDVSESHRISASLERREGQQAAVAQLGLVGLTRLGLDELFEQTVRQVQDVLSVDVVMITEGETARPMRVRASVGAAGIRAGEASLPGGADSLEGFSVTRDRPVVMRDRSIEKRFEVAPALGEGLRSGLACAIGETGSPFGVISVYSAQAREFDRDDANFLTSAANVLAATVRRREVERTLEESRRNFTVALRHSPTVFYQCDADLRYTWVGKPHPLFPAGELLGKRDDEVMSPERASVVTELKQQVLRTGKGIRQHHVAELPNGREHYDLTIEPLKDEEGRVTGLTIAAHDMSDQMVLREKLEANTLLMADQAEELETLYQSVPAGLAVLERDGRLSKLNAAMRDLLSLGRGQSPARADLPAGLAAAVDRILEGDTGAFEGEVQVEHEGDKRYWWCSAVPQSEAPDARITLVVRDLTDRRIAERRMAVSERRFRSVFDQAAIGIAVVDSEGMVLRANHRIAQILDRGREDAVEKTQFLEWIVPGSRDRARRQFIQAAADGTSFSAELQMLRMNGGVVWTKVTSSAFRPHTEDDSLIVLVEDISERKRSEAALQEAAQHKDEFLAMLGHELRNPLAALRYSTDLLETMVTEDQQLQRVQKVFDRQVNQMRRLVGDLLDVSRIERGKLALERETLDLCLIVRQSVEDATPLFEAPDGVRLVLDLPEKPAFVYGDGARLAQVVDNLITNAHKFTQSPGEVNVAVNQDGEDIVLEIRDTGIGMAQELIDRIFEPFRQLNRSLDRADGGLGLGLSIVRGVVELHGGRVTAQSEGEGAGSHFRVRLPAAQPDRPTLPPESDRALESPKRRVLLIDDHADALESLQLILEGEGHEVAVASNGPKAVELAEQFEPDVVFCDIGLPGEMNGYDVARALREQRPSDDLTLIAITGFSRVEDRDRALEAGFDDHMAKPVGSAQLKKAVHRAGRSPAS